jgi:hypothetical protein
MPLLSPRSSENLIDTLIALRKRALRRGIWFQTLTIEDRILTDMIQRHVRTVKNTTLATVIARIMGKLLFAIKNSFLSKLNAIGRPIARAVAMKAYSYGNREALDWVQDLNYIRYMGLTYSSLAENVSFVKTNSGMMAMQHDRRSH